MPRIQQFLDRDGSCPFLLAALGLNRLESQPESPSKRVKSKPCPVRTAGCPVLGVVHRRGMPRAELGDDASGERRVDCCGGIGFVGDYELHRARLQDTIPAWSVARVTPQVGIRPKLRGGVTGLVLRDTRVDGSNRVAGCRVLSATSRSDVTRLPVPASVVPPRLRSRRNRQARER